MEILGEVMAMEMEMKMLAVCCNFSTSDWQMRAFLLLSFLRPFWPLQLIAFRITTAIAVELGRGSCPLSFCLLLTDILVWVLDARCLDVGCRVGLQLVFVAATGHHTWILRVLFTTLSGSGMSESRRDAWEDATAR